MKLAEWHEQLATEPLRPNQLGAIHGEFRRLGYGRLDRAARLEVTAELARCGPVESTRELTMGEAGRVINALRQCPDLSALAELLEPEPEPEIRPTLMEMLCAVLAPVWRLLEEQRQERSKGNAGVL
jgi:hypothetical protein